MNKRIRRIDIDTASVPRLGRRSSFISCRREPIHGLGPIPTLAAYVFPRRLAARKRISLAHVTGFSPSPSAAAWICCFSASVMGISIAAVLRSSGLLGGLPLLVSMPINIYRKISASTIASRYYSIHNNTRQEKTHRGPARPRWGKENELSPDSS